MNQVEFDRLVELVKTGRLSRRQLLAVAGFAGAAAVLAACTGSAPSVGPSLAASAAASAAAPSAAPSVDVCALPTAAALKGKVGDTLAIYNWAGYLDPNSKKLFGELYGVTNITEDNYPSNEDMLAKLQAGGIGQYDIVAPTGYMVETMVKGGLAEPLDLSKIPNYANIDDRFKKLPFDPSDPPHYVVKDWGTTGFGYRSKFITQQMSSWADFWSVASGPATGKVSVLDSAPEVIGAALKKNGFSYNSVDPKELDTALKDLLALKPHLAAFSSTYKEQVESGDFWLSLGWNGDFAAVKANKGSEDAVYVVPSEGTEFWTDCWVIPKNAPHLDAALAFIDFILTPAVQAKETAFTYYATGVSSAIPCMDPVVGKDKSVFPDAAVTAKLEVHKDLGDAIKLRDEIWVKFKTA